MKSKIITLILIAILIYGCENSSIEDLTNGSLEGVIKDTTTNEPISGVSITTSPGSSITTSDSSGNFAINDLIEGQYSLVAEKDGYIKSISNIYIIPGKKVTLDVRLTLRVDSYGTISGKLIDVNGDPVNGASVSTTPGTSSVLTDATGNYTMDNIPEGDISLTAKKYGFLDETTAISIRKGENTVADMSLSYDTETNHAPAAADNPIPANNTTSVSTGTNISWNCTDPNGDSLVYDIYLWADGSTYTKIATDVSSTTYNFSSALLANTVYYWFIVAKDSKDGVSVSSVWKFQTAPH